MCNIGDDIIITLVERISVADLLFRTHVKRAYSIVSEVVLIF